MSRRCWRLQKFSRNKNVLLGANITIYTDHKNFLANSAVNDRVFRWKQKIQEFGPVLNYINGHKNTEADTLSRLPISNDSMETMLNHLPVDPYNPLLNKNPMDLSFIHHHQNLDQALLKALKEDHHFSKIKWISITHTLQSSRNSSSEDCYPSSITVFIC